MPEHLRAATLIRVSTAKQADRGMSLEEQLRRVREHVAAHEWEHVTEYAERGVSGARRDRPELDRLLADAKRGHFEVLVIPKLDRLGRSFTRMADVKARLDAAGVRIVCLDPTIDFGTPTGLLVWANLTAVAEFEREAIGERVAAVSATRAAAGKYPGGPSPYGYRRRDVTPEGAPTGLLVPDPATASIVRRIYAAAAAGVPQRRLQRELNAEGVPSPWGAKWEQGTIRRILEKAVYKGHVEVKGRDYGPGQHDPIVPTELWDQVAALRAARRQTKGKGRGRRPLGDHLFTHGLLRCGTCGGAMSPRSYTNPRGGERVVTREVYECRNRRDHGLDHCPQLPVLRELIDGAALRYFERHGLDVDATRDQFERALGVRLADVRTMREEAEREEQAAEVRLTRVRRDYQDGRLEAEDWSEQRPELSEERDAARARVAQLRDQERHVGDAGALADAEASALRLIAEVRDAVLGFTDNPAGIDAMRAALGRLFDGFTLFPLGVAGAGYAEEVGLNLGGDGHLCLLPSVRRDVQTGLDETLWPELDRVPLCAAEINESGGLNPDSA